VISAHSRASRQATSQWAAGSERRVPPPALSKVFYADLSDPASLPYVAQSSGTPRSKPAPALPEELGRASTQLSTTRAASPPPHALRQMQPGDGMLVDGTLPLAHVRAPTPTTATAASPTTARPSHPRHRFRRLDTHTR
jgi:hypothetical protein